jgi:hypothetical protein
MRYWEFDVCGLIADFEKNKRTLASVNEALIVARGYLKNPIGETAAGEVERYIEMLEMREAEFRMYTDKVILGLNDLPEIERNVLKWWLIDHYSDERIIYESGIENDKELQKIKTIALRKFKEVIMPN